jgi:TRAP-type mannitol/chloroaromatic compound transport system permease small subunit
VNGENSVNEKYMNLMNRVTWFGVGYLHIIRLIAGLVIFCAGMFIPMDGKWSSLLMLICFVLCGYDVVLKAVSNVLEARFLDENLMIFLAFPVLLIYNISRVASDNPYRKEDRQYSIIIYFLNSE